jgi:hypothetical protein
MSNIEYKILGKNMEAISLYYGFFLIAWGVIVKIVSGSGSPTALIPSFIGVLITIFAILAIKVPNKKKLFMHIIVTFGLLTFLGGFRVLKNWQDLFGEMFWADLSQIMMVVTGGLFTYLCVQSFLFVRRNK